MTKRHVRQLQATALVAALAGAVLSAGQAGQDQRPSLSTDAPTFKAEVEYVEVDALVVDQEGALVRDLTQEDFEVFEDGRRQEIAAFSLVDIPIERADQPLYTTEPIEPDTQSNERPFNGRVYVLVLDDLHTDFTRSGRVRDAARRFIQRNLGANDLMAVVYTGGRSTSAQEFTSNKRLLIDSVERFVGRKLESAVLSRNAEFTRRSTLPGNDLRSLDPYEQERAHNARNALEALRQVAEWFGGVRGRRKTILFVSEGIGYEVSDRIRSPTTPTSSGAVLDDIGQAIAATVRSNVSIYAIDPRGLATLQEDTISVGSIADSGATGPNAGDPSGVGPAFRSGIGMSSLGNELFLAQSSLRELSEETNGFAAINSNNYSAAFDRIVRDNSSYYVLAYYPPSTARDGKFHRIEVRVTRPGLTVRARRGYLAPTGDVPDPEATGQEWATVVEALNSPLQVSGLTMQAFAAPFKGEDRKASVVFGVDLRGADIAIVRDNRLEFSHSLVDERGRVIDPQNHSVTLNLRPETEARAKQTGFRIVSRQEVEPGRYQLRLASHDVGGGAVGSLIYDLEVPDFWKERFSMSGIVITSMAGSSLVTIRPDEALQRVLPADPIAQRVFPPNDEIALYAEIYDNTGRTPHKVDIVTTVHSDTGTVYFKTEEERDSKELEGERGGYGYAARIPLMDLQAGSYVLTVESRSRLNREHSAVRHVRFRIASMARPTPSAPPAR